MMRSVICMPTYCERDNLRPLVEELRVAAPEVDVLVVDDASPDGTGEVADALAAEHAHVSVIHRTGRPSMSAAYIEGFARALDEGYEIVVQMDADFSHQPRYVPRLIEAAKTADVALGSRYVSGGAVDQWSLGRRVASRAGNVYVGAVLGMPCRDATSGFVAWRRHVLKAVDFPDLVSQGRSFQIELKYRAHRQGFTLTEVPIHFWDRVVGASKLTPGGALGSLVRVMKVRLQGD